MPSFSQSSLAKLQTCDQRLQDLFHSVIEEQDCTIIVGHRGEVDQNLAFQTGHSKLKWPQSRHNTTPSLAVDVAPYPIDWKNEQRFKDFAQLVLRHAEKLGIKVDAGATWTHFPDLDHFELI